MKKHKYLITFLFIFIIPILVYASCTDEEIQYFEIIKDNYKIEYTLDKTNGMYYLTLHNPDPQNYTYTIQGIDNYSLCKINKDSNTICEKVLPGGYRINVVGNTENCTDILKRTFLSLKPYNKYSEDPLCSDIKEFSLCQETYDKEIDYETFVLRVQAYKENKNKGKETNQNKENETSKIKNYIENNLFQIIVIAVFVILVIVTVTVTIITAKKSRRLEWESI